MTMTTKTFKGANVFMSRNLVPPEIFDSLHDALKHNGAELFLCCDPSRNGPNDYHIISSDKHEKFEDLRSKGCNLLGPQCVLSCAQEHKPLPKQGFTCCLAMDGVKILASGFEVAEKLGFRRANISWIDAHVEILKLVTAMGGVLHSKASLDVSFVIVKNVLAAKYKWALHILKKPIVTLNWLDQCWKEHRVVPQESYKVLPLSGLTICVTGIPGDARKKMEKLIILNGGKYSSELTRRCTHLICDAPEGDKYKVAKSWGHIHVVTRKWFDQSIARRVCLNEESYSVLGGSTSSINTVRTCSMAPHSQDKDIIGNLHLAPSSVAADSNWPAVSCSGSVDPDLEATLSQSMSFTYSDAPVFVKDQSGPPSLEPDKDVKFDGCVADDSQTEDNDLYLSDCRILFVGFNASEMRKLVNMVRRGGGSRYMSFNDKLTHIVVGTPSEAEKKEVRAFAACGVIDVVRTIWLEDCHREKKELPVLQKHTAYNLVLPKDPVCTNKGVSIGMTIQKQGKSSTVQSIFSDGQSLGNVCSGSGLSSEKNTQPEVNRKRDGSQKETVGSSKHSLFAIPNSSDNSEQKMRGSNAEIQKRKSANVFKGRLFRFSSSFPKDRTLDIFDMPVEILNNKDLEVSFWILDLVVVHYSGLHRGYSLKTQAEIVEWINQGEGKMVDDHIKESVHFTIECHGAVPGVADAIKSTNVSSHWIRSCLEDGRMLDVGSHILYSPLPCQIPLPGFKSFRFCVSQYDEKDRLLLRNLCFVLGAKFAEKLTKKVTHVLCKFAGGPKYEAACKWGMQPVTSEWIYECVKQNDVVDTSPFSPKEVTSQDREAGLCTMSQYPTQAARTISGDSASQFTSQSQDLRNMQSQATRSRSDGSREDTSHSSICNKKARILEDDSRKGPLPSKVDQNGSVRRTNSAENTTENRREVFHAVPDVASAIEDLLEQTSKIQDLQFTGRTECDKSIFPADCSINIQDHLDPHSGFGLSNHWINRTDKKDDIGKRSEDVNPSIYDGFSETQTESQVVGYEEDLSGRQMIIDRVRTRSSLA